MKISETWLREWVNPTLSRDALCDFLTNSGFEVESITPLGKDNVIDISITPNRGDCLSVMGLAKEIAALTQSQLTLPKIKNNPATISDVLSIDMQSPKECPHYAGRIIRGVNATTITPEWIKHRLLCADIPCINPIVDVMNYVMLELGQPMHAFDLQTIKNHMMVRTTKQNEKLILLDNQTLTLNQPALAIADQHKLLAIAGVMGGIESAVTATTKNIFLESAFFTANAIAKTSQHYHIQSDSSYRFERGIDPELQVMALERATELLLEIAGGSPGPIIELTEKKYLPQSIVISLRLSRIEKIMGVTLSKNKVETILQQLGFYFSETDNRFEVTVPPRRSDLTTEIDLIEEIARFYGYENIPIVSSTGVLKIISRPENQLPLNTLRHTLCAIGYQEIITYSFVDKNLQKKLDPDQSPKELINPMTSEMAVMRTNLWPGLIQTCLYNQNRQQTRIRLFETGLRFIFQKEKCVQQRVIAGLISGIVTPVQWGQVSREVDFFDLKGDIERLLALTLDSDSFLFQPGTHPALHPEKTANLYRDNHFVGVLGALHPTLQQQLDCREKIFLFEFLLEPLEHARAPMAEEISKYPEIRRDIAILIDKNIPAKTIQDTIKQTAGPLLKTVTLFDVYSGKGILPQQKSMALALILQDTTRTLVDEEVAELVERVIVTLQGKFAAELRG